MNASVVRMVFSVARRSALQKQGVVAMQRVRANQTTMKSVP